MSEEIAIEVVLSKRDAEKAKLAIVNAELSKYESDKKALDEERRQPSFPLLQLLLGNLQLQLILDRQ
jgi:hypothetical protein